MATVKGVLADFEGRGGDSGKDAVEAVRRYAEVTNEPDRVAQYALAVARMLNQMAVELARNSSEYPKNRRPGGGYDCPARDEGLIPDDSHQADPCVHCDRVFHDRCFYTTKHSCIRAGLIAPRPGYGVKAGR